jgi:2,3,4,5-tetrahydropyridine-2-carboxylate N-succinyltransferase
MHSLQAEIERLAAQPAEQVDRAAARRAFLELRPLLDAGKVRAAEKVDGRWRVNVWVKQGILLGFRIGEVVEFPFAAELRAAGFGSAETTHPGQSRARTEHPQDPVLSFVDKDTFPIRRFSAGDGVRVVPGGSSVREGAYLAKGVICMPPMYVNVGAYVDEGTMIDSHALVGSCAQVGRRVHLSAAAQVGGVLEPVNASPVIIEDDVLVGGNCGIYEGTQVGARAVLGSGTILTRSTPLYDLVKGEIYRASSDEPLKVPENAVVVPGSRAVTKGKGSEWGLSLYTPVIVKYRDEKTDRSVALEEALR